MSIIVLQNPDDILSYGSMSPHAVEKASSNEIIRAAIAAGRIHPGGRVRRVGEVFAWRHKRTIRLTPPVNNHIFLSMPDGRYRIDAIVAHHLDINETIRKRMVDHLWYCGACALERSRFLDVTWNGEGDAVMLMPFFVPSVPDRKGRVSVGAMEPVRNISQEDNLTARTFLQHLISRDEPDAPPRIPIEVHYFVYAVSHLLAHPEHGPMWSVLGSNIMGWVTIPSMGITVLPPAVADMVITVSSAGHPAPSLVFDPPVMEFFLGEASTFRRTTYSISIGGDPEFNPIIDGSYVSGRTAKARWSSVSGTTEGDIGTDGASDGPLELRPDPAQTPGKLVSNIRSLMQRLSTDGAFLKTSGGSSCGGHFHIGIKVTFANGVTTRIITINRPPDLITLFDNYIARHLYPINRNRSRSDYSRLGTYREQPHGFEYRPLAGGVFHEPRICFITAKLLMGITRRYFDGHSFEGNFISYVATRQEVTPPEDLRRDLEALGIITKNELDYFMNYPENYSYFERVNVIGFWLDGKLGRRLIESQGAVSDNERDLLEGIINRPAQGAESTTADGVVFDSGFGNVIRSIVTAAISEFSRQSIRTVRFVRPAQTPGTYRSFVRISQGILVINGEVPASDDVLTVLLRDMEPGFVLICLPYESAFTAQLVDTMNKANEALTSGRLTGTLIPLQTPSEPEDSVPPLEEPEGHSIDYAWSDDRTTASDQAAMAVAAGIEDVLGVRIHRVVVTRKFSTNRSCSVIGSDIQGMIYTHAGELVPLSAEAHRLCLGNNPEPGTIFLGLPNESSDDQVSAFVDNLRGHPHTAGNRNIPSVTVVGPDFACRGEITSDTPALMDHIREGVYAVMDHVMVDRVIIVRHPILSHNRHAAVLYVAEGSDSDSFAVPPVGNTAAIEGAAQDALVPNSLIICYPFGTWTAAAVDTNRRLYELAEALDPIRREEALLASVQEPEDDTVTPVEELSIPASSTELAADTEEPRAAVNHHFSDTWDQSASQTVTRAFRSLDRSLLEGVATIDWFGIKESRGNVFAAYWNTDEQRGRATGPSDDGEVSFVHLAIREQEHPARSGQLAVGVPKRLRTGERNSELASVLTTILEHVHAHWNEHPDEIATGTDEEEEVL